MENKWIKNDTKLTTNNIITATESNIKAKLIFRSGKEIHLNSMDDDKELLNGDDRLWIDDILEASYNFTKLKKDRTTQINIIKEDKNALYLSNLFGSNNWIKNEISGSKNM